MIILAFPQFPYAQSDAPRKETATYFEPYPPRARVSYLRRCPVLDFLCATCSSSSGWARFHHSRHHSWCASSRHKQWKLLLIPRLIPQSLDRWRHRRAGAAASSEELWSTCSPVCCNVQSFCHALATRVTAPYGPRHSVLDWQPAAAKASASLV